MKSFFPSKEHKQNKIFADMVGYFCNVKIVKTWNLYYLLQKHDTYTKKGKERKTAIKCRRFLANSLLTP